MSLINASIIATTQNQEIKDGVVDLYQLTSPNSDKPILYFHPGLNDTLDDNINFRDATQPYTVREYIPMPLHLDGVNHQADGALNRPTLTVANVTTDFSDELGSFKIQDLVGYKITKRTTLESHLNSGSAATPPVEFPSVSYVIDRIEAMDNIAVVFELAAVFDLENIKIPKRTILGKYCNWEYEGLTRGRGACSWDSTETKRFGFADKNYRAYFTEDDEPIILLGLLSTSGTYGSTTNYSLDSKVQLNGAYYISAIDNNKGNSPEGTSGYWRRVHPFTNWATGNTYTTGSFVKYSNTVWKCVIEHTSDNNKTPSNESGYWVRGDICGKKLFSCQSRYACRGNLSGGTSEDNFRPSMKPLSNNIGLPFGGFPGVQKAK